MARYQYKREPLTNENADRLMNACSSGIEKVVISTLLDTGLRVSELAGLTKENVPQPGAGTAAITGRTASRSA